MKPSTRLMLMMIALALSAIATFLLAAHRQIATALPVWFIIAAGILTLTFLFAVLARPLAQVSAAFDATVRGVSAGVPKAAKQPGRRNVEAPLKNQAIVYSAGYFRKPELEGDTNSVYQAQSDSLAQHEQMVIGAVESASFPIIVEALDGTITAWNGAAERLYNYTAAEAIGSNTHIMIPAERREEHRAIFQRALADERIDSYETVRMSKDGRKIDVSISVYTVKSASGAIVGVATIGRDISMRRLAEEKFRLAVEACPSGMVMTDRAGRILMINTEIERMFGYRREELIDQSVDILVPDRFRARHVIDRIEYAIKAEARRMGAGRELFGRRKDGQEFPVEIGLNPISAREGLRILSVIVDISERKQAEEMFHLAVEACPNGMIIADHSGKVVMVNSEIERMFGYPRGTLIGQGVDILVPERLRSQHAADRAAFAVQPLARRMGRGHELSGLRRDGTEFPVEVALNPIHVGNSALTLAVIVDITERKHLERLKSEFVSTVSHELRTPLTSIFSSLGLLAGKAAGELPESARRLIAIAHANSQRLVRLVNDILDIEKLESGRVIFKFKAIELLPFVEQAIEANRGFAEKYRVRVQLDAPAEGEVQTDPDRLSQVFDNLLSNAIKFSPPDGDVVVSVQERDDFYRLSVRDHGPGIPPDFKRRIFEKFAQAETPNANHKTGTGLGLSIVKQIMQRLGGEVSFADAPGGGTIFHVDLPRRQQPTVGNDLERPKILHVGKDQGSHELVARALGSMTDVVSVHSIKEAERLLIAGSFDLVLLDREPVKGTDADARFAPHDSTGNAVPIVTLSARSEISVDEALAPDTEFRSPSQTLEELRQLVQYRLAKSAQVSEECV